jgi:ABC-type lipoprotein export system ATPase subunit
VTPVLEISGVVKSYSSLRPLRVQALTIAEGERVALSGFDAGAAEVLVNLVTAASLPDEGSVRVLGQDTSEIRDPDAWLASLDRFGIVSPRGVLPEPFTIQQNLAMPLTLAIDDITPDVKAKVSELAHDCGIESGVSADGMGEWLQRVTGEAPPHIRARLHLARAIATSPALLVMEHPGADLSSSERLALAERVAAVAEVRRVATLIITADDEFAKVAAHRALRLQPATGALKPVKKGWFR